MRKLKKPNKAELYAKIARMRSEGRSILSISKATGMTQAAVLDAIDYIVVRYQDLISRGGKGFILAEQAMAIELTMNAVSKIAKDPLVKPDTKLQAFRLREDLRKDWLNLLAQAGVVQLQKTTFFDEVTSGMTPEQKVQLVKLGIKRLRQIQNRKAEQRLLSQEAGGEEDHSPSTSLVPNGRGVHDSDSGGDTSESNGGSADG